MTVPLSAKRRIFITTDLASVATEEEEEQQIQKMWTQPNFCVLRAISTSGFIHTVYYTVYCKYYAYTVYCIRIYSMFILYIHSIYEISIRSFNSVSREGPKAAQ